MFPADFDFELPDHLIAQAPASQRQESRMLIVNRSDQSLTDSRFACLPAILRTDDLLVMNNTKVIPARLQGKSETGASIELFLIKEAGSGRWSALARPARRLRSGKRISFGDRLSALVVDKLPDGKVLVDMETSGKLTEVIDELGRTPLPPYIRREQDAIDNDRERYQTVYAKNRGAIAAPTAGLHFTPEILADISGRGTATVEVTLHVGYGTFEPIRVNDLAEHRVTPEEYEIEATAAETLEKARISGKRLVAVGTTTVRTLEANIGIHGRFTAAREDAELTITPGYDFRAVGAMLTNFHLPRSSLLVLTSTFGGHDLIMKAYQHAVSEGYRFYSYGDCMLII